ncbi:MAG: DNA primase [Ruminococcaceae bacterium]|nr:DNA primase [Oscillospiraceae bacterium]
MIPSNIIDDIRFRCEIESTISGYVQLRRAGRNLKGLCPFHSERTPSFTVYPENQSFYCFGCGAGGDVINFVMRMENLDYISAVEYLADKAGITLPSQNSGIERDTGVSRKRILAMNVEAARFYRSCLLDERIGAAGRAYFQERGLSSAIISRFGLGFAPISGTLRHLKSLGFTENEIQTGYFCGKSERGYYDYFRGRVMFPIIDVSGNVIAFGGRVLDDSKPKYLNTSDTPAFKKSKNLFALNFAKKYCENGFILCEGYMDVIALHAAGFQNAIATLGTAITAEQARILKKYASKVIITYDSDEAGQKATARAMTLLEEAGIDAKVLKLQDAKDPDEYIKKFGAEKFRQLIEGSRSKFDYLIEAVTEKYNMEADEEKIKALNEVCLAISRVYSNIERDIYIEKTAKIFAIDPKSIQGDVDRLRRRAVKENDKKRRADLIRNTSGSSDRVNPDFMRQPKAARLEEEVLGMLFLHNELLTEELKDGVLTGEDFSTEFGRRLYVFFESAVQNGGFSIGMLGESFTPDEVSRATRMLLNRSELPKNDGDIFRLYAEQLREETKKAKSSLSIADIINQKRTQK